MHVLVRRITLSELMALSVVKVERRRPRQDTCPTFTTFTPEVRSTFNLVS